VETLVNILMPSNISAIEWYISPWNR